MIQQMTTKYQDAANLLAKALIVKDLVSYNSTLILGEKYQDWIIEHAELIEKLISILEIDADKTQKPKLEKFISFMRGNNGSV